MPFMALAPTRNLRSSLYFAAESEILVTYTSVVTNSDGTTSTTTGVMQSSTPKASGSNTGKTWGIVGVRRSLFLSGSFLPTLTSLQPQGVVGVRLCLLALLSHH